MFPKWQGNVSNAEAIPEMANQEINADANLNTPPSGERFQPPPENVSSMEFGDTEASVLGIQIKIRLHNSYLETK